LNSRFRGDRRRRVLHNGWKSPRLAAFRALVQAPWTDFTRRPRASLNTYASGGSSRPAGSARRISSISRVEIGIIRSRRVFSFSAQIVSSRRLRLTSHHCSDRISPGRHAVSSIAVITPRRCGLAASRSRCSASASWSRLLRGISRSKAIAASLPTLNGVRVT
jgi:hypothetical protein